MELSIQGEKAAEIVNWLRKKYEISVLASDDEEALAPIESTEFWKEMEKNRVGNLLAGARLKAGLTQGELAGKLEIRQNMVSDYERGKRSLSAAMAKRFGSTLQIREEQLAYGPAKAVKSKG
ncbi:MAG: helix-turn-helix transcriptional regulator [Candidatus Aminicenantes bacterium]|nr:helix-turn-helix transcriptional regulator [Candidatus Aminicenantes bacterium]